MVLLAISDILLIGARGSTTLQGKSQRTQHENIAGKVDAATLHNLGQLQIIAAGVTASNQQNDQLLDRTQHIKYDLLLSTGLKTNLRYI